MKVVFITGGSRGIGRAMVELFTANGYKVAFTYKSSDEAARELSLKTGALAIKADSADKEEVEAAAATAIRELSGVDCLINNAGVSSILVLSGGTDREKLNASEIRPTYVFENIRALLSELEK